MYENIEYEFHSLTLCNNNQAYLQKLRFWKKAWVHAGGGVGGVLVHSRKFPEIWVFRA